MSYVLVLEPVAREAARVLEALAQERLDGAVVNDAELAATAMASRGAPRLLVFGSSFARQRAFSVLEELRERFPGSAIRAVVMATFASTDDPLAQLGQAVRRVLAARPPMVTPSPPVPTVELAPAIMSAVLDQLDVGVLVIDDRRRVRYFNYALAVLTGAPSDLVGQSAQRWAEHMRPLIGERAATARLGEPVALDQPPFELELARHPRRILRVTRRPVRLPEGEGIVELFVDATTENELQELARIDSLTGLSNRRGGEEALKRETARAQRAGGLLAVVLFDLDRFKRINDTLGHATGDEVLRVVSRVIDSSVRSCDVAARWGGEELLIVLPGNDLASAHNVAERVRSVVEALVIDGLGQVTISAGAAQLNPGETMETLLARADSNLYQAKSTGRNRVC